MRAEPLPPEPEPVMEENKATGWEDDGWGAATNKGKGGTKDKPVKSQGKKGNLSVLALEIREYVEAEGAVCPNQAGHLLEEQMWKNCRIFQGFLIKLFVIIIFLDKCGYNYHSGTSTRGSLGSNRVTSI